MYIFIHKLILGIKWYVSVYQLFIITLQPISERVSGGEGMDWLILL